MVSDILILRKRDEPLADTAAEWEDTTEFRDGVTANRLFVDHPEYVAGTMTIGSGPFGPQIDVTGTSDITQLGGQVERILTSQLEEYGIDLHDPTTPNATRLQNVRNGSASPEEVAANAQYNYYSYVILFRDVIYNGGGNTLPINLSYLDTAKPLQQFSVTLGQCVDKDQTTSPNLLVRTSSYGDSVTAGQAFDLSLGLYATDGNENLDDVIVSLTLPENISLNGGSLSSYLGTICPKQTRDVTFQVMPASGFTGTVASITVNMTGTGSVTGKEVSGTTTISVPVSQPDRFEVGQLELSGDTIYVGDTGSVSLSYVNKGKNPVSNLEARLTGTNLGAGGYQYLGNLAAGTEGSVDFDIVPDAAGTVSGIITLNYEDASGNPQTFSKDFSVSAEEMNMDDFNYDPSMDDVQPEQTGMPVWAWVLIGVCGAVVVIVVIVVVVRKRKKAKALAALEAEDSDEDL
mgnify:CR=1 FL=1